VEPAFIKKKASAHANIQVIGGDVLIIKLKNVTGWTLPDKLAAEPQRKPIVCPQECFSKPRMA